MDFAQIVTAFVGGVFGNYSLVYFGGQSYQADMYADKSQLTLRVIHMLQDDSIVLTIPVVHMSMFFGASCHNHHHNPVYRHGTRSVHIFWVANATL
jgi:hypothetical protein